MSNNIVLQNIKNKDVVAFKKVFFKYYKELTIYAYTYLRNIEDSEDTIQEVFTQLWKNADNIHIKTPIKWYLYNNVRNHCIDQLKARGITDTSSYGPEYYKLYLPEEYEGEDKPANDETQHLRDKIL